MATLRVALTFAGPAAIAGAKSADATYRYAIAHDRLQPAQLLFKDGPNVIATFLPRNPAYDAASGRYAFTCAIDRDALVQQFNDAGARNLEIEFHLRYYAFFLQIVRHMSYAAGDDHNFADPPDQAAVTNTFNSVATTVNPTDKEWTVTFQRKKYPVRMRARVGQWNSFGSHSARVNLDLRTADLANAPDALPLLQRVIATEWSAFYDDVRDDGTRVTGTTRWRDNVKAFMLRYVPLTRGARLIQRAYDRGWVACQAARDNGGLNAHERQQRTLTVLRDEIDRFLITANPWGEATNGGAYPTAVHVALAALYKRFQVTPIGVLRKALVGDLTAGEKMRMSAQMGMGNCAEHANITFHVIKSMLENEVDALAMLRYVVRTGYLNIDHAFVTGGERPARIVNALFRQDHHRGRANTRIRTWDSFAAVTPGAALGRQGWICDPYLAAGGIPETLTLLGDEDRLRQWLTWRGNASIHPAYVPAAVADAANASSAGHIHIPMVCDREAPTLSGIAPQDGPVAGGTVVTFTGTHFDGRLLAAFGNQWGTNVIFGDATTATATTPAMVAGAVDAAVYNHDNEVGYRAALPNAFTYHDPPTVTGVVSNFGSTAGGQQVTVSGTNFVAGQTAVSFNGTAGTNVNVTNGGSLTVRTPAHVAGQVAVSVTTPGGTGVSANAFEFRHPPTVTNINPDEDTEDGGAVVTIIGTHFRVGVTVTFGVVPSPHVVRINANTLTAVAPAQRRGDVDVIVRNADGLSVRVQNGFNYRPALKRRR